MIFLIPCLHSELYHTGSRSSMTLRSSSSRQSLIARVFSQRIATSYKELKKAYEESIKKCSELEKEIEDKDLRIEHLTELLIKRNKMLFGQKSEKGKYICDGQLSPDGIVLNEAEEQSDFNIPEPTADTVIKKSKKTGKHRGRKEIRADLETKKVLRIKIEKAYTFNNEISLFYANFVLRLFSYWEKVQICRFSFLLIFPSLQSQR